MLSSASKRVLVLLNDKAGTLATSKDGNEADVVLRAFADAGIEADMRSVAPPDVAKLIADAQAGGQFQAVIVGGGDGTLNCAANALIRASTKLDGDTKSSPNRMGFGVLPLGTHNHFAKDLGVPLDLKEAIAALADRLNSNEPIQPLAVAEVNGTVFLNFSGVGLHPRLVERRDAEHKTIKKNWPILGTLLRKLTKPLAMVLVFIKSLNDLPIHRLTLVTKDRRMTLTTTSVIVCNNLFQIEQFGLSDVSAPTRGVLNVYVARTRHARGILRLILAVLTRRLRQTKEFEGFACDELTIHSRRHTLAVSLDGEVVRLQTPLVYRMNRDGLRVIVPQASERVSVGASREL